ncbi:MAG: hypothetical protein EOP07_18020, partial [Proteobacteria bacterium]
MNSGPRLGTESGDSVQKIDQQTNDGRFKSLILSALAILGFYCPLYAYYGAHLIAFNLLLGAMILTPLIFQLNKRGYRNISRILFVLTCNAYVFQFALGLGHEADAENYCIPLMMLGLLLFDFNQRPLIVTTCIAAFTNWILITWNDVLVLPANFIPSGIPVNSMAKLNFIGAFVITGIFFMIFVRTTNRHR